MNENEDKRILVLLSFIIILFISLVVYLTYFMIFEGDTYRNSSQNKRNMYESKNITRGSFLDRNNQVIVYTAKDEDGKKTRVNNYPVLYSHIIGYNYKELGKSGLELTMDDYLTNKNNSSVVEEIKKQLKMESVGNNIKLTIDTGVQKEASELLGDRKGAVVAMNPKTGEIYAIVSKPEYDSSTLVENWAEISENNDSPLFNRAINGLYPPGSIMKVISTASILDSHVDLEYEHTGTQIIDGYQYKDSTSKVYGKIGLDTAFTKSLNTYFVDKIQEVGKETFEKVAGDFLFGKEIPFELPVSVSKLNFNKDTGKNQLSASAIGQGRVVATPLDMALMASAIANDGVIMKPFIVEEIINEKGEIVKATEPEVLSTAVSPEIAKELSELMVDTTYAGTGKKAQIKNIKVAGKTGTAENETEFTHAWYVGFAPADDPVVAVSVIVEQGGLGGDVAAPIGGKIMQSVLNNIQISQN